MGENFFLTFFGACFLRGRKRMSKYGVLIFILALYIKKNGTTKLEALYNQTQKFGEIPHRPQGYFGNLSSMSL
jgi:hypothetical protein